MNLFCMYLSKEKKDGVDTIIRKSNVFFMLINRRFKQEDN